MVNTPFDEQVFAVKKERQTFVQSNSLVGQIAERAGAIQPQATELVGVVEVGEDSGLDHVVSSLVNPPPS